MKTKSKSIGKIAAEVHKLAWEKGWHSHDETEDHFIERTCNNLHDEVSELHEGWRNNRLHSPCDKAAKLAELGLPFLSCLEEELADIVIRVLDASKKLGVDIRRAIIVKHEFNRTRPRRHGGKRS